MADQQHGGVNAHSAADLLRQAMMQRAAGDDEHDHIGSNSSTPPGVATPKPDLTDKRLPGILHSYFGQVCDSLLSRPKQAAAGGSLHSHNPDPATSQLPALAPPVSTTTAPASTLAADTAANSSPLTHPQPTPEEHSSMAHVQQENTACGGAPLTAPHTPPVCAQQLGGDEAHLSSMTPPLASEEHHEPPQQLSHPMTPARHDPLQAYPTPPVSSASSMRTPSKGENGSSGPSSARGSTSASQPPARAHLPGEGAAQSVPATTSSTPHLSPAKSRRQTYASPTKAAPAPLLGVLTAPNIAAAHISNPARSPSSTNPSSPILAQLSSASASASASRRNSVALSKQSQSNEETSEGAEKKLTEGVSSPLRTQNTPPQTPRTRSQESKQQQHVAQTGAPSPLSKGGSSGSAQSQSSSRSPDRRGAPARPPKGKLSVSISEGRGLRPSVDPYVVCQFQWAEYISDGPKNHEHATAGVVGPKPKDGLGSAIAIRRTDSDMGRPMAIPMRSRQSSNTGVSSTDLSRDAGMVTDPKWDHDAIFDVVGEHSEIDVSIYDRSNQEAFLGHVRFCPNLVEYETPFENWFPLEPRENEEDNVTGEIKLRINFQKTDKKHFGPEDFQILKLIGKGTFGQVFQVRKKDTKRIYAMKVLSKKVIVQKKEVAHTLGERNILVRTAMADSPFIVGLKFSFQTPSDLYLVTDYMSGGELFWHLQKEGRFQEARAKFYIAELILALQHLHEHDIVYRDLKPENILLDANGHIALCDFGLSKANIAENDTTNTFCGTTEYLAPEVLLDEHGYTKMVDFWSLGVLVFEMCCGWSPFYAEDTQQMYKNIAFGKVRFPRDALSTEGRNFVKGLLNRNPKHRLGATSDAEELKAHPFFADIEWESLSKKNVAPPFKPKLKSELDVSNFDPEFTNALGTSATGSSLNARAAALAAGMNPASTPLSPTMQANFKGFTFVDESAMDKQFDHMDEDDYSSGKTVEADTRKGSDDDWELLKKERGDRMSGIMTGNDNDDGVFSHTNFDV
ncbi:kinase-like domain-containing protein [Lineolata rhizophorae]|uniref:non-specific serine/threonine protein kinase n=1 Tax=Lineolata rhizophorae TaxID=578093 RepID=A0A6A6NNM6_9PEZI|nr:kinase-like domain-containing protein [Lineolata rhizophorae]